MRLEKIEESLSRLTDIMAMTKEQVSVEEQPSTPIHQPQDENGKNVKLKKKRTL